MSTPKYLIAQYTPDRFRKEPRNIGVVVWTRFGVKGLFQGEKMSSPGEVDGRKIPGFIQSPNAYRERIGFWRRALERGTIQLPAKDDEISADSIEFLEAMQQTGRGRYSLKKGGELLDDVNESDTNDIIQYLYQRLVTSEDYKPKDVAVTSKQKKSSTDPLSVVDDVIEQTKVSSDPYFHTSYELQYQPADDVEEQLEFDYAYMRGSLNRLFEKFKLPKQKRTIARDTHDSIYRFERAQSVMNLRPDQCVTLIYYEEDRESDPNVKRSLGLLGTTARIIHVGNRMKLEREFEGLASSNGTTQK